MYMFENSDEIFTTEEELKIFILSNLNLSKEDIEDVKDNVILWCDVHGYDVDEINCK